MKKSILIVAAIALTVVSCKDSEVMYDPSGYGKYDNNEIEFENFVGGMTRASRATGLSFKDGDQMEVYGFQITANPNKVDTIFQKKSVVKDWEKWSYEYPKYWNASSIYDFYAMFPYSEKNTFDYDDRLFSVADFTVAESEDDQVDLMIAKRVLNRNPSNTVQFEFNHILSNVSFYFKPADNFNTDGIESVEMVSFDVKNLYRTGSFAQSGWDNNAFVGTWTADEEDIYDLPQVTEVTFNVGEDETAVALANDLLLLPQEISDDAAIDVVYTLYYGDNTTSTFTKSIKLNKIVGINKKEESKTIASWEPNYRYIYTMSINPSQMPDGPIYKDDFDQDDYEDASEDDLVPTVSIIQSDEDLDQDGINDYWVDVNNNGEVDEEDYPVIWKDIDQTENEEGLLTEEALPDRDKDGQPDDTDNDGHPDVIWYDSNGDGIVDTEYERSVLINGKDGDEVDYDGGKDGYFNATGILIDNGEYYVDADGDGEADYHILWKNIDDDDELEGIVDKNRNDSLDEGDDSFDNDGKNYLGEDEPFDVVLIYHPDETDPAKQWEELVKIIGSTHPVNNNEIIFSAKVVDWVDVYNAE